MLSGNDFLVMFWLNREYYSTKLFVICILQIKEVMNNIITHVILYKQTK